MWLVAAAVFGLLALFTIIGAWLNQRYGRGAMSPMSETMEQETLRDHHNTGIY